ncbi:MAG: sporulation initiation factor Spo0A C-terminal domain-containing protein [Oscillospiraceae bacterium]|nr:sporulation initiation factor Spo0A C-terminal domain-containing protein [Oscillospiraceae bacterium]
METSSPQTAQLTTARILLELSIPAHRMGYLQLCIAIPAFAGNKQQSMAKELYPSVADAVGCLDWRAVEHAIRTVIADAWKRRNPEIWAQYFPGSQRAPSNKQFIATLAEYLE